MKILKYILIGLALFVLVARLIFPMFVGPLLNYVRTNNIAKELSCIELPPETKIVEIHSESGNLSGTGNHVEILVCMLLETGIQESKIVEHFKGYEILFRIDNDSSDNLFESKFIELFDEKDINEMNENGTNYYINRELL